MHSLLSWLNWVNSKFSSLLNSSRRPEKTDKIQSGLYASTSAKSNDFSACTSEFLHPGSERSLKLISYYLWCLTWTATLTWQYETPALSSSELQSLRLTFDCSISKEDGKLLSSVIPWETSVYPRVEVATQEKLENAGRRGSRDWEVMYVDDSGDRILQGKLIRLCLDFSTLRTSKPLLQVCSVVVDKSLYIGHLATSMASTQRMPAALTSCTNQNFQMLHAVQWRSRGKRNKLGPHLEVSRGSSPTPVVWINCFLLYLLIITFLLQKSSLALCEDLDSPLHALLKLCSSFIQQKHIRHLLCVMCVLKIWW